MSDLLSVKEVAERLKIPVRTVQLYCKEGRIKAQLVGKQYVIHADQLPHLKRSTSKKIKRE
jgi:excisionase family DNA binding protein